MQNRYFDTARKEILPWLPRTVSRLLDVGCGTGATTLAVRAHRALRWAGGIEYVPEVAEQARARFDRVWTGDAAAAPIEQEIAPGSLDLVLCLDVLEHMVDPWSMTRRLAPLIAPGGRMIVSVPNIRNSKFLWRLITRGDFIYRDSGLLDRTHLRFFVRATAIELATPAGLDLVAAVPAYRWTFPDARWFLSRASLHGLDAFMAKQWLVVVERKAGTGALPQPGPGS